MQRTAGEKSMTTDAPSRRGSMFIASLALAVCAAAPTPALAARVTEINEAIRKGELTKLPGLTHADADRIKKLQKYQAPQPGSQPQTEYLTKIDLVNRGALSQATYDAIKNKITVLAGDTDPKCRATLREPYRDNPPEEALDN